MSFAENILVHDLKVELEATHVLTDSKAAYDSVRSPGATKKSTHVERWLMFARDLRSGVVLGRAGAVRVAMSTRVRM